MYGRRVHVGLNAKAEKAGKAIIKFLPGFGSSRNPVALLRPFPYRAIFYRVTPLAFAPFSLGRLETVFDNSQLSAVSSYM